MRRIGLWMQCDVRLKRKKRKKKTGEEKKCITIYSVKATHQPQVIIDILNLT